MAAADRQKSLAETSIGVFFRATPESPKENVTFHFQLIAGHAATYEAPNGGSDEVSVTMTSSNVKTILGTNVFGRKLDFPQSNFIMNEFISHSKSGNTTAEVDCAFMYAGGESEKLIGRLDGCRDNVVRVATKANPWGGNTLSREGVRKQLETSLERMKVKSVQLFYLHAPDYTVPIDETLEAVNQMHREGKFNELGLSNYSAWQVAQIHTICTTNSWIVPTVYQGMYNCVTRMVEKELFPCLRHFNMKFYAYNWKHKFEDVGKDEPEKVSGTEGWVETYRRRFWRKTIFDLVEEIKVLLQDIYGGEVTLAEAAYRWLYHHSSLDGSKGDGVIIGCSTIEQYHANIANTGGPGLDERITKVMYQYWKQMAAECPDYMR
ncbi:aflatoxin B1 aldehyde reductase member 4-like [Ciona intestinalis]